jgi:hypothetical protein
MSFTNLESSYTIPHGLNSHPKVILVTHLSLLLLISYLLSHHLSELGSDQNVNETTIKDGPPIPTQSEPKTNPDR